eukprot:CAMPEP_0177680362 /NCGR_PEP_ID=MMETSP0447-20121125/30130_1 /TAXON_ID=0 /ORGANISM="Stygamoeba regulata, Strain BSH-02190019" /LENGTH=143 /DNA_ID=CAMNT_0019189683 /DNA_START=35 /DNA_END=463 /DNA_ORIENTATION=-
MTAYGACPPFTHTRQGGATGQRASSRSTRRDGLWGRAAGGPHTTSGTNAVCVCARVCARVCLCVCVWRMFALPSGREQTEGGRRPDLRHRLPPQHAQGRAVRPCGRRPPHYQQHQRAAACVAHAVRHALAHQHSTAGGEGEDL